jgi:hypothetical protein
MQLPPRHNLHAQLLRWPESKKTAAGLQLRTAMPPPRWTPRSPDASEPG